MYSGTVAVADVGNYQSSTCWNSLAFGCRESSALCPIAHSMNYLTNVLASGLQYPRAIESSKSLEGQASTSEPLSFNAPKEPVQDDKYDNEDSPRLSRSESRRPTSVKCKTTLRFANPPPKSKHQQRFHIRPRLVLQLQHIHQNSRPKPFLDVLRPSSHSHYPPVHLLRHGRGKSNRLGPEDLFIINSPAYDEPDIQLSGVPRADGNDNDDCVAVICRSKGEFDEQLHISIQMNDGNSWTGYRLRSGNYELVKEDEKGNRTVVRWVRRRKAPTKVQRNTSEAPVEDRSEGSAFTFSIIDPNLRRHAIIASLNSSCMEICDSYSTPPPLKPAYSESSSTDWDSFLQCGTQEFTQGSTRAVDNEMKAFIAISGIWVALSEGHSPNFQYDQREATIQQGQNSVLPDKHRSLSMELARSITRSSYTHEPPRSGVRSPQITIPHPASTSDMLISQTKAGKRAIPQRSVSMGVGDPQKCRLHGSVDPYNQPMLEGTLSVNNTTAESSTFSNSSKGIEQARLDTQENKYLSQTIGRETTSNRLTSSKNESCRAVNGNDPSGRKSHLKGFRLRRRSKSVRE